LSASAPPAGGDLLDDQGCILAPNIAPDQSTRVDPFVFRHLLLVHLLILRDGHHAFEDGAVLVAVNALRRDVPLGSDRAFRAALALTAPARSARSPHLRDGR
jgi:hypothetical protein